MKLGGSSHDVDLGAIGVVFGVGIFRHDFVLGSDGEGQEFGLVFGRGNQLQVLVDLHSEREILVVLTLKTSNNSQFIGGEVLLGLESDAVVVIDLLTKSDQDASQLVFLVLGVV